MSKQGSPKEVLRKDLQSAGEWGGLEVGLDHQGRQWGEGQEHGKGSAFFVSIDLHLCSTCLSSNLTWVALGVGF